MRRRVLVLSVCLLAWGWSAVAETPLIPRSVLFGNPDRASVRLSPDGKQLSYLAPLDGVLNVWVAPVDDLAAARAITRDKGRGIRAYFWAYTNQHVVYLQDRDGDENWRIYVVDLRSNEVRDLTPESGVQARIQEVSPKHPEAILIGLNDRVPQLHDLYRVNLSTGARELVEKNEAGYVGYLTDDDYAVRFAIGMTPDGGSEFFQRGTDGWSSFAQISQADSMTTNPVGLNATGDVLYMIDSRGRDTAALMAVQLADGSARLIAQDSRADVSDVMIHPTRKEIEAVAVEYERREWQILDAGIKADVEVLARVADGEFDVVSRTLDDRQWLVAYELDNGPVRYYHYDRGTQKARFLFTNRAALEGLPLVQMHPVVIPARDGLKLVSYLTLPAGSAAEGTTRPQQPVPLVLFVHGGPWARDSWGYNPYHQWFANRGYATLSVNFRGSTGFGKNFVNAGDLEWGRKMHDDLIDAVEWAVREGIAPADRIAIMGGSYGGYAALAGLTLTPDRFACGVSIVGPSNLHTLIESVPPYWKPLLDMFMSRVGDPRTEEGRKLLSERSPLTHVEKIARPLLIGQGANDPRVKQAESDQIVQAMEAKNIPVTYVLFPDEGHGFARPENRLAFNAVAEAFLAEHLGGRFEPIGDAFAGSSVQIPSGAGGVPGLRAALEAFRTEDK